MKSSQNSTLYDKQKKRVKLFFLLLLSFSCNPSKKGVILKGLVEFRIFGVAVLSVILCVSPENEVL